jgi:hypothetical protein
MNVTGRVTYWCRKRGVGWIRPSAVWDTPLSEGRELLFSVEDIECGPPVVGEVVRFTIAASAPWRAQGVTVI